MARQKLRFEIWMLGVLIVPIGIGIAVYSHSKRDSVDLGGECNAREQCRAPADACLDLGGRSVCTVMCATGCPTGFVCVQLEVTLKNRSGFKDLKGLRYCFKPEMANKLETKTRARTAPLP